MTDFDAATALTRADDSQTDEVHWTGHMTTDWSIGPVPNGGYTGALMLRGLLDHTQCAAPKSMTIHYYRPTIGDETCSITTEIRRVGRSATYADATLEQDGKVRARAVGVFADYPAPAVLLQRPPKAIPPPEDCPVRSAQNQGLNMTLVDTLEIRLASSIDDVIDQSMSTAAVDGWVRFRNGRANDALGLLLFADAFPPAVLAAAPDTGWVPTIELTVHICAPAAPGWIRCEVSTSNVRGGTVIEDVRLWDSTGALVVEGRQIAVLRPR
ncbi:MAG: acyl-CoA thioesterase [Verrucomicrobiales bacterium]|jgi:acyl-CoA thioesterase